MTDDASVPATGCLLCLVQASESMRQEIYKGPLRSKMAAALRVVEEVVGALVDLAAAGVVPGELEVGVVIYRTGRDGMPRLRPVLPGSSRQAPVVPLQSLDRATFSAAWPERAAPSGAAPARVAFYFARKFLGQRMADHPGALPPMVVHITDGESSDGAADELARDLMATGAGVLLIHCLFRQGLAPSVFEPCPLTPCGDLWTMSSSFLPNDESPPETPARRALLVNTMSASRKITQFVRMLFSNVSAAPAEAEAAPAETPGPAVEAVPVPAPVAEPQPVAAAVETVLPEPVVVAPAPPPPDVAPEPAPEVEPVVPAGPPRFEVRVLWTPKRGNTETEWEDGFALDEPAGVLALADGASDGVFTKPWVKILLDAYIADPIALDDMALVDPWLKQLRRAWFQAIKYPELRPTLQMKVDRSCGAATFLGFKLDPTPVGEDPAAAPVGWTAWAVGDVCLFHIRDGRPVVTFPVEKAADFGYTPELYQSRTLREVPQARSLRGELRPGDLLCFATDALAQWLFTQIEAGTPLQWAGFRTVDLADWRGWIESIRDAGAIVNDDCTMLVVAPPGAAVTEEDSTTEIVAAVTEDEEEEEPEPEVVSEPWPVVEVEAGIEGPGPGETAPASPAPHEAAAHEDDGWPRIEAAEGDRKEPDTPATHET